MSDKKRGLIIVSNRLPLSLKKVDGKYESSLSSGGLVTALSGVSKSTNVRWFGWPGSNIEDPDERKIANDALWENGAVGIFLDEELAHSHYNVFSNGIAWPILHYQSGVDFNEDAWKAYQKVNEIFADTVAQSAADGDLIWIHDYHLLLLPAYLRDRLTKAGKHCPIGFTLHTPFPAEDFWRALPVQKELLSGVLACDLIGFHTDEYKRNFIECCARGLDVSVSHDGGDITYGGHTAHTGTFIVGIDPTKFTSALSNPDVQSRIGELEEEYKRKLVILGVDRLDYTKGLVQKLHGYDAFLHQHPDLAKKTTLIQVAIPSREDVKEYQDLEREISMLVGKISGTHSTPDGSPIVYMHHSVPFTDLTALYRIADMCLITSRRDGMNLVAAEYVACQGGRFGVLVLSELAGAAAFMSQGSVTFNPSSVQQMADAIYKAATMGEGERRAGFETLGEFVRTNTSEKWGETFTKVLAGFAGS
ncbi:trehalose-6-phosphate synthase [Aspergillus mulundensis]|uniref:Synthase subunit of trehalose-6-phosphate synthase complex n=1 Tax=Aspergillus mulundensis TaxID=1810919 RepID=A0A3D8RF74_9EURO|nr:Synthase subunit of trehalose-6-phosphate synthase complex [Aspergillus mulundensis]RDW72692.1 Synthase subunit of trehalose-6-phosphate synthase complex [Aspergillus mulundensis]